MFFMSRMKFMNTHVDNLDFNETLAEIERLVENTAHSYVVTPNVDHIVKLENDEEFLEVYNNATLILTDGKPLIWIAKLYGKPIKEKISGSDLFPLLCGLAAKKGYRMFFLGAAEGVAATAAEKLTEKNPGLNVVGTYSPKMGFEKDAEEIEKIIGIVNESKANILIVGLGAPKQEKFIYRYKDRLDVNISLGLGASLDFEAGSVKRAPAWMSRVGLEWFYRLCKEPKRMFKRYIIDDMQIIKLAWKYRKQV
jgi:exopolysaccharide biosynthesis WecB/TagA/CpsF family protein